MHFSFATLCEYNELAVCIFVGSDEWNRTIGQRHLRSKTLPLSYITNGSGGWTRTNVTEVMGLLRNPFSTPQSKKNLIAKCTKGKDRLAMCCRMAAIC